MSQNHLTLLPLWIAAGLLEVTSASAQAGQASPADQPASAGQAAPAREMEPSDSGDEEEAGDEVDNEDGDEGIGLNFDVEVSSAYVWRGSNLWGPEHDSQNLSVFPGFEVTTGGLRVGYWSAYQLTGETKGDNVDEGMGAEQDLYAGYDLELTDELTLTLLATYYVYPLADEAAAGTKTPMYVEPALSLEYVTVVDLGLSLSYFRGLQEATDLGSHVYASPSVGKSLELTSDLSLELSASFGYKVWTNGDWDTGSGNNWDVLGSAGVYCGIDDLYFLPALHLAFTDAGDGAGSSEGLSYWGGVNVGYDVAL